MSRAALAAMALCIAAFVGLACAGPGGFAIVVQDETPLRAAAKDSAKPHTLLFQGEALEVRGETLEYLQVYDYRRERGGYVPLSAVRRFELKANEAPELLAVMRFVRDTPGSEALGIGYAAAYIQAAPSGVLSGPDGVEALDLLGRFSERLARRASGAAPATKEGQARLSAHLDVAARYGVQFLSIEGGGRIRTCYEGDAFKRVLEMNAGAEAKARAALALTRPECIAETRPVQRFEIDQARAEVLDSVDAREVPAPLKNRLHLRRATVHAALAFSAARRGEAPEAYARRALAELVAVRKADLTESDTRPYDEAALRVNATRWAAVPAKPATAPGKSDPGSAGERPRLVTYPQETGETCLALVDAKHPASQPLARRCTYGHAWLASASLNREGTAMAVAVQQLDGWRELWVFRKSGEKWTARVLPPATFSPGVGYAELAGWVPGGTQMLVAREAVGEQGLQRAFEVVRLDTLATVRKAGEPGSLSSFNKWQDVSWRKASLAVR